MSPMLFTVSIEVFKRIRWEEAGIKINRERLNNIRFAADMVLFSNNGDELQQMIEELSRKVLM